MQNYKGQDLNLHYLLRIASGTMLKPKLDPNPYVVNRSVSKTTSFRIEPGPFALQGRGGGPERPEILKNTL